MNVRSFIQDAFFARGIPDLKIRAVWIGGLVVALGEELLMKGHKACVARLFERNDLVLDAFRVYGVAPS